MFCPNCRAEFREGVVECPECSEPLVPFLRADEGEHEMDYVRVFETTDSSLLPVVKSVLEGAGIAVMIEGEEALGMLPVGGFGSGEHMHGLGARVHVPRSQAAEARDLLDELDESDFSEE